MRQSFHTISDTINSPLSYEISIEDFAQAIQLAYEEKYPPSEFWNRVIWIATNGKLAEVPFGQRQPLLDWIRENKRELISDWTRRSICTLNNLLISLDRNYIPDPLDTERAT